MEVAGDAGVGAEGGAGDAVEGLFEGLGEGMPWAKGMAFRLVGFGVEEDGFVDEVLMEECSVEVRAAFEEEAEDVAVGEGGEDCGEAEVSGVVGDGFDLSAEFGEGGDFGFGGGLAAEDEEVVVGCDYELRGEGDAEVGVEDDAEEWAAAGHGRCGR